MLKCLPTAPPPGRPIAQPPRIPYIERLHPPPFPLPLTLARCLSLMPLHPFILRVLLLSSVSPAVLHSCSSSDRFLKVGIAAQLPSGAHLPDNLDYKSYWNFLLNRHDAYESLPTARLDGISYVQVVLNALSHVPGLTAISYTALPHRQGAPSSNTSTGLTI